MKKAVIVIAILALAGAIGWKVYTRLTAPAETPRGKGAAMAVNVEPVEQGSIRDLEMFTGTLLPKSQFVVSPKIAGRLDKLSVDMGDLVRSGQLIASLDDAEYSRQVEQSAAELQVAEATVEECRSTLDVAKREYDRSVALREKKIASESELDTAEAQYRTAQAKHKVALAQVAQKEAALRAAEVRRSYTRIAPEWPEADRPWIVGERYADQGQMLRANDPIVSLLEINTLTGVIHVTERDYPKVHVGQNVSVTTDAFPDRVFGGRVVRVAPLVKETSREARVEIEISNEDLALKPGMFVRAEIEFARHDGATLVPSGAIVRRDDRHGLFLADTATRKAKFVPVKAGIVQGGRTEILEPELDGLVVVLGQHLLENDAAIILPETGPPAEEPRSRAAGGRAGGESR